eukprot:TRINITY_DN108353_c0_g1_i1.p1 TRINITY_DN108353_c0_g1~~TRINITY_DN108353_c0_g1_i1.p1  ORF type:complete len:399 (-),score=32.27 TRINITY_DN108353_c0_g1_i1:5-1201(-)
MANARWSTGKRCFCTFVSIGAATTLVCHRGLLRWETASLGNTGGQGAGENLGSALDPAQGREAGQISNAAGAPAPKLSHSQSVQSVTSSSPDMETSPEQAITSPPHKMTSLEPERKSSPMQSVTSSPPITETHPKPTVTFPPPWGELERTWLDKYGDRAGSWTARAGTRRVVWLICTGRISSSQAQAFKLVRRDSYVVSLNKFLYDADDFKDIVPTHHWMVEAGGAAISGNGSCLQQWINAGRMDGFECKVAGRVIGNAARYGIHLIAKSSVIKLARSISSKHNLFHHVDDWDKQHPLPLKFNGLTLGNGIPIAISLEPGGALIKLLGCTGSCTRVKKFVGSCDSHGVHYDVPRVTRKLQKPLQALRALGPGWEVVNCDQKSHYVRNGLMQAADCFAT